MVRSEKYFDCETYSISSPRLQVSVMTLGATVTSIRFDGRETVLGYGSVEEYRKGTSYIGAIVGRYANRIAGARFAIDGKVVQLVPNEGANQLHGGPAAFDRRIWQAEILDESAVRFMLRSPDGDNGYPGNLTASVTYTVRDATLRLDFAGDCDQDTVFAPTSHIYFKLGDGSVLENRLQINGDSYVPVDSHNIPNGPAKPVDGAFDFRAPRKIGRDYDHCFVLNGPAACCVSAGGIRMELRTDYPALQLYTGSALAAPHRKNQGLALEPEFVPDSPNRRDFPSPVLRRGEHFGKYAEYTFSNIE